MEKRKKCIKLLLNKKKQMIGNINKKKEEVLKKFDFIMKKNKALSVY